MQRERGASWVVDALRAARVSSNAERGAWSKRDAEGYAVARVDA